MRSMRWQMWWVFGKAICQMCNVKSLSIMSEPKHKEHVIPHHLVASRILGLDYKCIKWVPCSTAVSHNALIIFIYPRYFKRLILEVLFGLGICQLSSDPPLNGLDLISFLRTKLFKFEKGFHSYPFFSLQLLVHGPPIVATWAQIHQVCCCLSIIFTQIHYSQWRSQSLTCWITADSSLLAMNMKEKRKNQGWSLTPHNWEELNEYHTSSSMRWTGHCLWGH